MSAPGARTSRPRFHRLADWLSWQEQLHGREVDLGLDRCRVVAERLGLLDPPWPVVTVAGTNGKGSTVAMLESVLHATGLRVGCYSSPHLVRYQERIRIGRREQSEEVLCAAFERIDEARGEVSLTYFEFGTLAALVIFSAAPVDVAVLEVGLGGRLDAVNLVDADVSVVTTIGIDHVEWLGPDRESIGREKAGVYRSGRPAVCVDRDPPASLLGHAAAIGAELLLIGRDFDLSAVTSSTWDWRGPGREERALPRPRLQGEFQLGNAAGVLMALHALAPRVCVTREAIEAGLREVQLAGRFQVIPGPVEYVLDVAHNPHAAEVLARTLAEHPVAGRTHAVLGMLRDKDARGVVEALAVHVDDWALCSLAPPRGADAAALAAVLPAQDAAAATLWPDVPAALDAVAARAQPGDRVLVMGSFLTVAAALRHLSPPAG